MPQDQLVDLPEQVMERPRVNICSPKLMILAIIASYFVATNVYYYYQHHPIPVPNKPIEVDSWKNFMEIAERLGGYAIVTVVGFIVFYFLKQSNDKHQEEKYLKMKQQQQKEDEKQRQAQALREQKIFKKMQEEERLHRERIQEAVSNNNICENNERDSFQNISEQKGVKLKSD